MSEIRVNNRASNIELYRILVMFMILCGHYVFNSDLLSVFWGSFSTYSLFYSIFGMWGKVGINCFVLISGYFMCTSKITLRKFLKLYLEVFFYSILLYLIFVATGKVTFDLSTFLLNITPFWRIESDRFVSAYLVWWMFIPFLNILVKGMNSKQHLLLIMMSVVVFTIYPLLPFAHIDVNPLCWFSTLYMVASYLRLYPNEVPKHDSAKFWGGLSMVFVILSVVGMALTLWLNAKFGWKNSPYWLVMDSNAPLALLLGVSSFLFFKNIHLKHSSFINAVASTTFGVLLIHANTFVRPWLWNETIDCAGHCDKFWYAIIACVLVFSICSFIDWIRINTIEKYVFDYIDRIKNGFRS